MDNYSSLELWDCRWSDLRLIFVFCFEFVEHIILWSTSCVLLYLFFISLQLPSSTSGFSTDW
jgi:hypothetical protein